MNYIEKLYENYLESIKLSSSGEWCKPIKNFDEYYHPEPYTKEEFLEKIKTDVEFSERWLILK